MGPLSGTTPVSGSGDLDLLVRNAERVGDDLRVHGAGALADLRARGEHPDAGGGELDRRARGELELSASGEPGAVPVERETDPPVRSGVRLALAAEARAAHRGAQHFERAAVVAQRWPVAVVSPGRSRLRSRRRTGSRPSASAMRSMWTSTAELGLRRAEAAERAVGRRVGEHRPGGDPDVRRSGRARPRGSRRGRAPPARASRRRRRRGSPRCPSPRGGRRG